MEPKCRWAILLSGCWSAGPGVISELMTTTLEHLLLPSCDLPLHALHSVPGANHPAEGPLGEVLAALKSDPPDLIPNGPVTTRVWPPCPAVLMTTGKVSTQKTTVKLEGGAWKHRWGLGVLLPFCGVTPPQSKPHRPAGMSYTQRAPGQAQTCPGANSPRTCTLDRK